VEKKALDIIILSFAKDENLKLITQQGIDTLLASEKDSDVQFNILVLESNKGLAPFQYANAHTIYPKQKFGFNKYINIALKQTANPYVCIANNDLIYKENWADEILLAFRQDPSLKSASPICSIHHPLNENIQANSGTYPGYQIRREISGWCIVFKRELLKTVNPFDEKFEFWYCDNDYAMTLEKHQIKHALVSSSIVDHLESITLKTESEASKNRLTTKANLYFIYKWRHKNYLLYRYHLLRYHFPVLLKLEALLRKK